MRPVGVDDHDDDDDREECSDDDGDDDDGGNDGRDRNSDGGDDDGEERGDGAAAAAAAGLVRRRMACRYRAGMAGVFLPTAKRRQVRLAGNESVLFAAASGAARLSNLLQICSRQVGYTFPLRKPVQKVGAKPTCSC